MREPASRSPGRARARGSNIKAGAPTRRAGTGRRGCGRAGGVEEAGGGGTERGKERTVGADRGKTLGSGDESPKHEAHGSFVQPEHGEGIAVTG